jgi:type II secretory pathway predicted ATPase ExeA
MYRNFFSLSELPFSISPDPKYLFMSDRHREALAHLTYGLGEVGGFALLTGEVGTGKTTISRCLMEQLPENTQAAFILNPTLSSKELLATLCDELKIRYRKTDASLKILTDKISEKLLKNHENDINTLLIIDEAQHLQPEVLEQLRLLTNLETNTKKLLQVILIGQPELQQLLQRRDLRQLAQRITARYHLMPLTKPELSQYIQHRLTVSDCTRAIFDKGALAKIHQLSQGIPRLTNLLCHSALMLAYNQNDSVVNKKTVILAAERALGSDILVKSGKDRSSAILMSTTAISLTALVALASFWWGQTQAPTNQEQVSISQLAVASKALPQPKVDNIPAVKLLGESTDLAEVERDNNSLTKTSETSSAISVGNKATVVANSKTVLEDIPEKPVTEVINTEVIKTDKQIVVSANKPDQKKNLQQDYQVTEMAGVSDDLLARFQAAIEATQHDSAIDWQQGDSQSTNSHSSSTRSQFTDSNEQNHIRSLTQMSQQLQNAIPALNFEQHIYASDGQGWIKVNGRDRYEGDTIGDNLIVEKILPQQVILSFQGEKFSLPALTNW